MCLRVSSQDIEWHQQRNVRYWLLISQYRVSSAAKSTRMISQWVNTQQVCHESRGSSGPLPSKCYLGTPSNSPLQLCHLEHRASRSPQQGRENRRVTHLLINALTEVTHINSASTHNSFTITSRMTLFNYVSIREFVGVCGYLENGVSAQFWLSYIIILFFAEVEIGENAFAAFFPYEQFSTSQIHFSQQTEKSQIFF